MYSTKQLAKLLENTRDLFFSEKNRFARELFFAASQKQKLEIQVLPTRSFFNAEGIELFWNPIGIDKYPDPQKLEELQREQRSAREFLAEHELEDFQQEKLHACTPRNPKTRKKAIDMEGRYHVTRYGKAFFRGVERTVLFLQAVGDDGAPTQDFDEPVWGYFLQEETDRKNIEQLEGFLYCQLGRENTTPQKKKDRLVALFAACPLPGRALARLVGAHLEHLPGCCKTPTRFLAGTLQVFSLQNARTPSSPRRAFSTAFLPAARCRSLFSQLFPEFWSLWRLQALCSRFFCRFSTAA